MRLLVDECIFAAIVDHLRRDGHDVRWVRETMRSADDKKVLHVANAEQRVIVSEDRDFGDLIFREQYPAVGIVSVRVSEFELTPQAIGAYVAEKVRDLGDQLIGHFTVIEPGRERLRPLLSKLP